MHTAQKILVPVDFSEQSANGLTYAASLAQEMKAELIVLHVIDKNERNAFCDLLAAFEGWPISNRSERIPVDYLVREKALDLYHFIERAVPNPESLKIRRRVRIGKPVKEILAVAQEENVDLMVLEIRKKSLFSYLTTQGKVLKLIWKFPYPVLLAPPISEDGRGSRGPLILLPILKPPQL